MRAARAVLVLLLLSCASQIRLEYRPGQVASRRAGGAVAAEDGIAAEVGAAVLREGGNAVDAAVATAFALGVTFPQAGNPGGGGFAVVALPREAPVALDFRETAPAAASRDMFLRPDGEPDRERSLWSVAAAGVPGTPAGLAALHARFGRLPWARLVEPAERLAAEGFPIPAGLAKALNAHRERFARSESARDLFVLHERPWREGDVLVQRDLARTLASIRERGAEGFYRGRVAAAIAEEARAAGGALTEEDLAAYRPVWREPARFTFGGSEVLTMPLPSSGGVVLRQILGVLEATGGPDAPPGSPERVHLFAEAERRAFADRNALLGDPAGMPRGLVRFLTSRDYVRRRAAMVDPARATPSGDVHPAATGAAESTETTNLCVVDREGGAVALTYTLNASFGTHIVVEGTGVILNNEMDDFAAKPGSPNQFGLRQGERNAVVPGRRMLSSMSPTLVRRDGRVVLALGSPGGPRILSAVAQVIVGHIGDGLPLDLAVLVPRVHHQHLPDVLFLEDAEVVWPEGRERRDLGLGPGTRRALEAKGHALRAKPSGIGSVTAIAVDPETGTTTGVVDPRSYGATAVE